MVITRFKLKSKMAIWTGVRVVNSRDGRIPGPIIATLAADQQSAGGAKK